MFVGKTGSGEKKDINGHWQCNVWVISNFHTDKNLAKSSEEGESAKSRHEIER